MHIADSVRFGLTAEEAHRQVLIALGGIDQTKESYRDRRGFPGVEAVVRDVRFGLRLLRKNPGFAAVAVLTLALRLTRLFRGLLYGVIATDPVALTGVAILPMIVALVARYLPAAGDAS